MIDHGVPRTVRRPVAVVAGTALMVPLALMWPVAAVAAVVAAFRQPGLGGCITAVVALPALFLAYLAISGVVNAWSTTPRAVQLAARVTYGLVFLWRFKQLIGPKGHQWEDLDWHRLDWQPTMLVPHLVAALALIGDLFLISARRWYRQAQADAADEHGALLARWRILTPDQIGALVGQLDSITWSWQANQVDRLAATLGWPVTTREHDRVVLATGYLAGDGTAAFELAGDAITRLVVPLSDPTPEGLYVSDHTAAVDQAIAARLGPSTRTVLRRPVRTQWRRATCTIEAIAHAERGAPGRLELAVTPNGG
jgi:hypothetical protein